MDALIAKFNARENGAVVAGNTAECRTTAIDSTADDKHVVQFCTGCLLLAVLQTAKHIAHMTGREGGSSGYELLRIFGFYGKLDATASEENGSRWLI